MKLKTIVRSPVLHAALFMLAVYFALSAIMVFAQSTDTIVSLPPGGAIVVTCPNTIGGAQVGSKTLRITCPSLVPTVTSTPIPTRTPAPATATPTPMADHSSMSWHAPGAHGGIPAHDHGDAPSQWVLDAGYVPAFDHPANTPNENALPHKHSAMKGWAGAFGTGASRVQWYGIFHLDQNPGGYVSRFHSYQLWVRDVSGAVSHFHGWLDFGQDNNTGPNLINSCEPNNEVRPQIFPMQKAGCTTHFENWYSAASGSGLFAPDFGFNLQPNYYLEGVPAGDNDANDPATWTPVDGSAHMTRRIEFAWYADRSDLRGDFWTTQWGDEVEGPTDALCDGLHTRTYGTKTYTVLCLKQTVQPSLTSVVFPSNSVQRTFGGSSVVRLPN